MSLMVASFIVALIFFYYAKKIEIRERSEFRKKIPQERHLTLGEAIELYKNDKGVFVFYTGSSPYGGLWFYKDANITNINCMPPLGEKSCVIDDAVSLNKATLRIKKDIQDIQIIRHDIIVRRKLCQHFE